MRKLTFAAVAALFVLGFLIVVFIPADAQDDTDERLSSLETQVAAQATQIADIQAILGTVPTPDPSVGGEDTGAGVVTVSGVGVSVSEDFELPPGRYQVTATWETGIALIADIWDPSGGSELLFNELVPDGQGGISTVIYVAQSGGIYFLEVSNNDGPWSISFEPR